MKSVNQCQSIEHALPTPCYILIDGKVKGDEWWAFLWDFISHLLLRDLLVIYPKDQNMFKCSG